MNKIIRFLCIIAMSKHFNQTNQSILHHILGGYGLKLNFMVTWFTNLSNKGINDFSFQFRKIITRYRRVGYNLDVCDSLHV